MTTPRLEIFLNDGALCIAKVEGEQAGQRLIIDIDVEELTALPASEAAYRVGGTVLNILKLWHRPVFGDWAVPSVFEPPPR